MNQDKERELWASTRRNPFWIILILLLALACDYSSRMSNLIEQRKQLSQTQLLQNQNVTTLAQAQQLERRLERLSFDLLQIAMTNAAASQIVRDFNIQWNSEPAPSAQPPTAGSQQTSVPSPKSGDLQK